MNEFYQKLEENRAGRHPTINWNPTLFEGCGDLSCRELSRQLAAELPLPASTDVMAVRLSESDDEGENVLTFHLLVQELKVARWHTLGIQLGMTEDEIKEIEQDHPGDTARRRTAMLDKWLKKQTSPSWESIIEALENMSEKRLANKLRNKYMSPSLRPSKQPAQADVCLAETQPTSSNILLEVDRSDPIPVDMEELRDLYYELVTETEKDLENANLSSRDIKRFSQVHMTDEVSTVEELFDQLKPFFFLDYALLEKIIKVLLKQKQSVVNKIDDYIRQLKQFKKSTTLQKFIEKIETAQNASPQICTVTLQLVGGWLPKTISDLEKLLKEIFRNKAAILTRLKIVRKCVLVTYLVQRSEAVSLIEAARPKISFMKKVGVCVLQVGDTVVTSTQSETSDFSFESSLIRSVKDNDIDVLSFLLDINTSPDATDDKGLTGLLWASHLGRRKATKLLLKANANSNLCRDGVTPLFMASQNGYSNIVCFILNANADPNLHSIDGVTPLFIASQNGHSDIVSFLLNANANPNLHRDDGVTPLFMASKYGHFYVAVLLLNANADPNLHSIDGVTPLFMASQNGHSYIVSFLLNANADPDHYRDDGVTPLFMASQNGHSDIVNILLNANANPNICSNDGVTPLFMASQNGHSEAVSLLLRANAYPNLHKDDGVTPLIMASQNGHSNIVNFLLNANADPNLCRDDGVTPLFMASQNEHSDIVSFLLNANANPNLSLYTDYGVTPLFIASENGYSDIVRFVLNANANPNLCRRNDGVTPLFMASQNGHSDVVVLLLLANANPNHQTCEGMTPLMAACLNCYPDIVKLLLTRGADPNLRDFNNSTALDFAHLGDSFMSIKLLLTFGSDSFPQTPDLDKKVSRLNWSHVINTSLSQTPGLHTIDEGT